MKVVLSAPSGAGKTTIIRNLLEQDERFCFSVSTTTRALREGEKDGVSYYFVERAEFESMKQNDEFIEWALVHGNYYGTSKKEVDRIVNAGKIPLFDVDVQGARSLKKSVEDAVFIFIIPPALKDLEIRLRKRNTDTDDEIQLRINNAIDEMREYEMYDYIVINNDIQRAVHCLKSIVDAELCRNKRHAPIIRRMLENDNTH